jgi:hypothetical protein
MPHLIVWLVVGCRCTLFCQMKLLILYHAHQQGTCCSHFSGPFSFHLLKLWCSYGTTVINLLPQSSHLRLKRSSWCSIGLLCMAYSKLLGLLCMAYRKLLDILLIQKKQFTKIQNALNSSHWNPYTICITYSSHCHCYSIRVWFVWQIEQYSFRKNYDGWLSKFTKSKTQQILQRLESLQN